MMKKFEVDYDSKNDSLFVYTGEKSKGAVEVGPFVLDLGEKGNLVAMEVLNSSEVLANLLSKIICLTKINNLIAEIVNFRNMANIKFSISDYQNTETATIILPKSIEKSPALNY